jgi:stage III sporulation protein AB
VWNRTAFKTTELEILKQFGETLGKHDLVQQQKQIRLALTHLEREEEDEAREKQASYGKDVSEFRDTNQDCSLSFYANVEVL